MDRRVSESYIPRKLERVSHRNQNLIKQESSPNIPKSISRSGSAKPSPIVKSNPVILPRTATVTPIKRGKQLSEKANAEMDAILAMLGAET